MGRFWLCLFCIPLIVVNTKAQTQTFFSESTDQGYYDSGLAYMTAPSFLEQAGTSNDKLPIESELTPYKGKNALKLRWNAQPGGNWSAYIIKPGFGTQDISASDTLSFYIYSETAVDKQYLPLIYMEGGPGSTFSLKYSLSDYTNNLPDHSWVKVKIPLSVFFSDPNQTAIQFNKIKSIILGQNLSDGIEHTLYIDEVKAYKFTPVSIPSPTQVFSAVGYDSHVDLKWQSIGSATMDGYHLYRSTDNGSSWKLIRFIAKEDKQYLDFTGQVTEDYQYQLSSVATSGIESIPSAIATASVSPKSDSSLLDMVQQYTFRYFWDFGHPNCGMARERNTSGDVVTTGGTGFGVMAIIVAIERGFITREQGLARLMTMTAFLQTADRFHGAFPHWMNGNTGKVIPFSQYDNGGDIVETAFLMEGLLTARQYFNGSGDEQILHDRISQIWEEVEWNWYRKLVYQVLYWHWSPNYGWQINFAIHGYNEALILYILSVASPTHSVPASLYQNGWATTGYVNSGTFYGFPLLVGPYRGGPLFFAHYSFLGFDPRYKKDAYCNYFLRNRNHTLINRAYCIDNPEHHSGYSNVGWGLTASDDPYGYLAHEPTASNDNGTISPTAALSSMPYTPIESTQALKHFYRDLGKHLFGPMGFYDAYNPDENWWADSYLAIDQGPIIGMIENSRTGLLWQYFMSNPEIQPALNAIGFVTDTTFISNTNETTPKIGTLDCSPNPANDKINIELNIPQTALYTFSLIPIGNGSTIRLKEPMQIPAGKYKQTFTISGIPGGVYLLECRSNNHIFNQKLLIYH